MRTKGSEMVLGMKTIIICCDNIQSNIEQKKNSKIPACTVFAIRDVKTKEVDITGAFLTLHELQVQSSSLTPQMCSGLELNRVIG